MSLVDPRVVKQAKILVDYSLEVKGGENVVLIADFEAKPLVLEIYKLLIRRGANEIRLKFSDYEFTESYFKLASKPQIKSFPEAEMDEMKKMDCYIRIGSSTNTRGMTNIDAEKMSERAKVIRPITDLRVEKTRWVVTRFPTNAQAQEADMSLSEYEDYVFSAINKVNWEKKFKEQEILRKRVDKTSNVRIAAQGTELSFVVKNRKCRNAGGSHNMPDGEVFTSVVENSSNGYINFTYPALYLGREYNDVYLQFKNGRVIKAKASKGVSDLNKILGVDPGARRIGEFGIGNNYKIRRFTKDILFDEKIGGTIHLALGSGYKETLSKNKSAIHWDMIKDLRKDGEIWFDGKLVQRNGKWLIKV